MKKTRLFPLALIPVLLFSACAADEPILEPSPEPTSSIGAVIEPSGERPAKELGEAKLAISDVRPMEYSSYMRPNDNGEYYWQIVDPAAGYPESGGTDFILAHACEGSQVCIGDELRNLQLGDVIMHKGEKYEIMDKRIVMKQELPNTDIWFHDANRVVIITCVIEGSWQDSDKNEVLIAMKP